HRSLRAVLATLALLLFVGVPKAHSQYHYRPGTYGSVQTAQWQNYQRLASMQQQWAMQQQWRYYQQQAALLQYQQWLQYQVQAQQWAAQQYPQVYVSQQPIVVSTFGGNASATTSSSPPTQSGLAPALIRIGGNALGGRVGGLAGRTLGSATGIPYLDSV